MDGLLLIARLSLAAVFAVSGVAKLVDRSGTAASLRGFGVPLALTGPLTLLLPLAELAGAAGLIPRQSAPWAAAGILALLLLFIAAISVNLARGRRPDCHCFGQIHSTPIGPGTIVRNIALAVVAAFVVWQQPIANAAPALAAPENPVSSPMLVVLLAVCALLTAAALVLVFQLLRQNGRMLARLDAIEAHLGMAAAPAPEGLAVDTPAPSFELAALERGDADLRMSLATLEARGKPLLLVFSEPGCGACDTVLPDVARWQREHADRLTTVVISRGLAEVNRAKAAATGLGLVLLQKDREIAEQYRVVGTPSAVLVDDGAVASPLAIGPEKIRALVADALARPALCRRGDLAPALELPDLDGRPFGLNDLGRRTAGLGDRGRRTALLFWNPTCGFCQQMLPDITAWERNPAPDAPALVVVSSGPVADNRAQGFRSLVLLDNGGAASEAFSIAGTPSAVLVDGDGRIASRTAVGKEAVLALLKSRRA